MHPQYRDGVKSMSIQFGGFSQGQPGGVGGARCRVTLIAILVAAITVLAVAPCAALECPMPRPAGSPDAIQETPAQINELAEVLAAGDLTNRMPAFVHALRARHSSAQAAELVNYLVTAYCPVVNRMAIGEAEKQKKLDDFAGMAAQAAF